ncbi:hypothetical protein W97_01867 [Coniosporium apollinis CBS 100218]|uniref:Uncharacterized protein n=1 Tax=Coniosporium apollinis (strain CBS 100218) TaxID=1168221 RepID=R7YL98_CONA1|nr:uncharacterized protein W97_01867 [Coniosporium apollinis CBS 100218]EON62643.1 hypothetical protein W97_01867 [Coniosporium apollinis CBS 100218]
MEPTRRSNRARKPTVKYAEAMAELMPKDALRTAKGGPKVQKPAPGMTKLKLKLKPRPATNAAPSTSSSKATTSPAPKVAVEKKLREAGKVVGVLVPLPPRPSNRFTAAPVAGPKAEKEQLKEPQVYFATKQEEDMEAARRIHARLVAGRARRAEERAGTLGLLSLWSRI